MYNLYFTSGRKALVARLQKAGSGSGSAIDILSLQTNGYDTLMRWSKKAYMATTVSRSADIDNVILKNAAAKDDIVCLHFVPAKGAKEWSGKELSEKFIIEKSQDKFQLKDRSQTDASCPTVTVRLLFEKAEGEVYEAQVRFHRMPQSQVYDVVLDFGSEASQMLITSPERNTVAIKQEEVLKNTLVHFYGSRDLQGTRVYDQQEEDDRYLFRSIFFRKKSADKKPSFVYDIPSKDDEYFRFISRRTSNHDDRLPNIKISYLSGALVLDDADPKELHRSIVCRFLHEAIRRINDYEREKKRKVAVNFTALLPNVMPQEDVSEFLNDLNRMANSKEFRQANGQMDRVEFVSVSSCSESDASFLECVHRAGDLGNENRLPLKNGKRYLIVDVGKGTTDFSIVRLLSPTQVMSEYRAGFVGAGNAISYGVFYNYMYSLANVDDAERLIDKMLSAPPADLYKLETLVEDAKKHWEDGAPASVQISNIEALNPETVNDKIENVGPIDDSTGNVAMLIDRITSKIMNELPMLPIDYIVFSGRSFKFASLYNGLKEKLTQKFGQIPVYYDEPSAKSGCLFGPMRGISVSLESRMVGTPLVFNPADLADKPSSQPRRSPGQPAPAATMPEQKKGSMFSKIGPLVMKVFGPDADDDESRNQLRDTPTAVNDNEVETLMNNGKKLEKWSGGEVIVISGNQYKLEAVFDTSAKGEPHYLYFDGDSFYIKNNNSCHRLLIQAHMANEELLKESLFPYSKAIMKI